MVIQLSFIQAPVRKDGPFNYFCLDAAALLPVLMLDLESGDHVLDICSGPGAKSLAIMQTLKPARLVCNDVDQDAKNLYANKPMEFHEFFYS